MVYVTVIIAVVVTATLIFVLKSKAKTMRLKSLRTSGSSDRAMKQKIRERKAR